MEVRLDFALPGVLAGTLLVGVAGYLNGQAMAATPDGSAPFDDGIAQIISPIVTGTSTASGNAMLSNLVIDSTVVDGVRFDATSYYHLERRAGLAADLRDLGITA